MAGGIWEKQNKVRPGVYINFRSSKKDSNTLGERGVVTIPMVLPWGVEKSMIEISSEDNLYDVLGIDIGDESALLIREALKKAKKLLLYRVNTGTKATITNEGLTATAKYSGVKGNEVTIVIQANIDDSAKFDVITLFEGNMVDKQVAKANIEELKTNAFVEFSGTGALRATAGLRLTSGTNGTVTNEEYTAYLTAAELYDFNTMALPSKDNTLKAVFVSFVKRLREEDGKKVQLVVENYPEADYEGVISVKNGVILKDGTVITADKAVAWVAAATAGASKNEAITYSTYEGAVDVSERYTNKEIEYSLKHGDFLFTLSYGEVVAEQDINSLTTFTEEKNKDFRKNRVIRVLDNFANDIKRIYEKGYLGKVSNNEDGRNLFKAEIIKLGESNENLGAIEKFTPQDVTITQGVDKDAVIVTIAIQPVDSMEKLYINVEVA